MLVVGGFRVNVVASRIDPGLLAAFIAVADRKSVSRAADVLHLSQPAVTAQIKRLEDGLGASVFLRSVQGMRLTPKGVRLYAYAREIARLLAEAQSAVAEGDESAGHLKIATSIPESAWNSPWPIPTRCFDRYATASVLWGWSKVWRAPHSCA
jgi:DNA-binding transcriptional LysR family regulator